MAMHWPADYAPPDEDELRPKQSPRSRPDSPKSLRGTVAAAGKGGRGDSGSRGGSGRRSKSRPKQRPGESPDEPMIKQRTGAGR